MLGLASCYRAVAWHSTVADRCLLCAHLTYCLEFHECCAPKRRYSATRCIMQAIGKSIALGVAANATACRSIVRPCWALFGFTPRPDPTSQTALWERRNGGLFLDLCFGCRDPDGGAKPSCVVWLFGNRLQQTRTPNPAQTHTPTAGTDASTFADSRHRLTSPTHGAGENTDERAH